MILIRKFVKLCCFMAVFIVFAGCGRDSLTVTNTRDTNVFVLDEELAAKPREGVILGTPLRRDEMIKLEDVINVWGEPVQVYDHENIQTYEYSVNGRRVLKNEDETGLLYIFQVEMGITRDEIIHYMGNPTEGNKPGKTLLYYDIDYRITFRKKTESVNGDMETRELILFKALSEY